MTIPTILIADDVRLFQEIVKELLQPSQVRILTAQDGAAALAIAEREHPDLVIMDRNMPRMDGLACCAAFKENPALRNIPVILVSNMEEDAMKEACRRTKCDDYMKKPLDGRAFLDMVRRFIPVIERRSARIRCRLPVTVLLEQVELTGVCEDLGTCGMYVACQGRAKEGSRITLTFTLPGSTNRIVAQGKVVWLNGTENRPRSAASPGFGVEFLRITGEGLSLLRENELKEYVEKRMPAP